MGNDWQDNRPKDRRLYSDARHPQDPQSSQDWDNSPRQDWRPQATGGPPPQRGPENRQPPGPRQTGNLPPHNGSGLISRARNGGLSGPLGPQPDRFSGPQEPQPQRTSGPLRPSSRGFTPPGQSATPRRTQDVQDYDQGFAPRRSQDGQDYDWGSLPRRTQDLPDYDQPEPERPRRSSGRQGSRQSDPYQSNEAYDEPPTPGARKGRRIGPPAEREQHGGGGLLSFARQASNTMRAIITGQHRAHRPGHSAQVNLDAPMPVFAADGAETEEEHKPKPYRRSRARLVIHKRWERRTIRSQRMITASIVGGFLLMVLVALSAAGGGSAAAFYADTQNKLDALTSPSGFPQTTRFYDRNGNLLWEFLGDSNDRNATYRTYVPLAVVPRFLMNATVDTEDKTFWTNSGVDVNSIIRAALANTTSGGISQGGSTITQQLIKNAFFVNPQTGVADENYQRKIQEAIMSYAVTQRYDKSTILEFYLNIIPYGYLSRGIEAAAENYFSKVPGIDPKTHQMQMGVQQLDLAQAALLAGLPQGPSLYSPCGGDGVDDRRAAALKRMHDVVLTSMLNVGDITQQQFDQADAEAHQPDFFKCRDEGTKLAPHFVDYVRSQLDAMLDPTDPDGNGDLLLAHAGWNIYTSIDLTLENKVEDIVNHYLFDTHTEHYNGDNGTFPPLSLPQSQGGHNINDSAVVVMDPNTGDILAMDGSGGYYKNDNVKEGAYYNSAVNPRPVGSSFKPIVYATAFEEGWSPAQVIQNERVCFPIISPADAGSKARQTCGQWYAPINYNDSFSAHSSNVPGSGIRIRDALGNSLNIPAVQAMYFAGLDNVINMAERMGITSDDFADNKKGPALALGAGGISLLQMADAYSVFANGGYHVSPRSILLITDTQGHTIAGGDSHNVTKTQVLSPQTAFLITSILADNNARAAEFGVNNALTFHDDPYVAAKTGTTDDFKDNVAMGYTPYLTVGVWSGNANDERMSNNTIGITGAAPIWHDVVLEASKLFNYPNSYWPTPAGVGYYRVNGATGLAPYQGTKGDYADWFNDAMVPDLS
jgi:membrane peptidoglycan carboxypeptidase